MNKRSSRLRKTKLEETGDDISSRKIEQIQKTIPLLAKAFANGFFTEVNCQILPENLLDQLAHQVYQFVQKQCLENHSLIFHSFINEPLLNEYVKKIYLGDFEENSSTKKQRNKFNEYYSI